jgi:4a-hydroxytetrahydrobiopterin dehydratase
VQRENKQIPVGWQLVDDQGLAKLTREFKFPDFQAALQFTNQVGAMAEKYHHHPLIELEWGRVAVWWWTHKTHGLTDLDHRLADQTSQLFDGASAV